MRLGEILVAEGLVTSQGVEEALESQVVHGGRLGTNLVELGLVAETDLSRALGKQHGVAFASGEMTPDLKALQALDSKFADDKDVLPMRIDATRVSVAVINPRDIETLDAVAFKTGKRVTPVVIPEFRMNQLLRRHCRAFRTIRAVDMETVRPPKPRQNGQAPPADLITEEEFQSLYAKALTGGGPTEDVEDVIVGELVEVTPAEALTPPAGSEPTRFPPRPLAVAIPIPPPTALSFAQAQAELALSANRDEIAQTVLRFAIGVWKRALLLSVQGPLIVGWRGLGVGMRETAVRRIGIALGGQSTFNLVCQTRAHHVGPMRRDAATAVFFRLLGGDFPTTAVLLPLLARGRVVNLLYVDAGPGQVTPPDVGELLILATSVTRSYDVLMKRRKAG